MRYTTRQEFQSRFFRNRPTTTFGGLYAHDIHIGRDALVTGIVGGSLFVEHGASVVLTGIVRGSVHVAPEAVLWVEGIVGGRVLIDGGAAMLNGICSAKGDRSAVVYDPSVVICDPLEPADGETGQ